MSVQPEDEDISLHKRYRSLVDKEFLGGLSDDEKAEMAELSGKLDEMDAEFYEGIIERLEDRLKR